MSKLPPGVNPDDLHSMSGYGKTGHPLIDAILECLWQQAKESPTGLIDSGDLEHALLFHLIQNLRATPAHYKKKRIAEVVKLIREYANVPLHPDQVTHMGPPGNA